VDVGGQKCGGHLGRAPLGWYLADHVEIRPSARVTCSHVVFLGQMLQAQLTEILCKNGTLVIAFQGHSLTQGHKTDGTIENL